MLVARHSSLKFSIESLSGAILAAEKRNVKLQEALEKMGMEYGCEPGVEGEEEIMLCSVCLKALKLLEEIRKGA